MAAGALWLAKAQEARGWRTIAFIGPDYEYGRGMWADLRSKLDELGVKYEVVGDLWPKLYEPDFALYISELKRLKPDVIVNGQWGGDFVAFVRQASALGLFGNRFSRISTQGAITRCWARWKIRCRSASSYRPAIM